jgi:hypothetical protein
MVISDVYDEPKNRLGPGGLAAILTLIRLFGSISW